MSTPLANLSPTLAAYQQLDCGLIRIGGRRFVFIDDRVYDDTPYATRIEAIDALRAHADTTPTRRQVQAHQAGVRG